MAGPEARLLDVTLLCDTSVYAAGELLVATQKIPNAMRDIDYPGVLQTITMIDEDNQGAAMDVYFLDAAVNFGRFNQLPTLTGVGARSIMTRLSIATTDWKTINNVRVATFAALNMPLRPAPGTTDIYVAIVNGVGTPVFSASGLKMRLGVRYI